MVRAAEPFALSEVWPLAERVERFGIAGFGWGAAWRTPEGHLASHLDTGAFRADLALEELGRVETTSLLVHLRRPSRLSTLQLPDTQPFVDPRSRYAFGHNGDLREYRAARQAYREAGRIRGRADSEVAARWLEDHWPQLAAGPALRELHATFGGQANFMILAADGSPTAYAGNSENPLFSFRLGRLGVVSSGLYSLDRSLFRLAAPGASARRLVRHGGAVTLDPAGRPAPA